LVSGGPDGERSQQNKKISRPVTRVFGSGGGFRKVLAAARLARERMRYYFK
jgi:hypothetical protein